MGWSGSLSGSGLFRAVPDPFHLRTEVDFFSEIKDKE